MTSVPPGDDETTSFAANPSHVNLDNLSYDATADPGPSNHFPLPGVSSLGAHFPETSDLYGDYYSPSTQDLTDIQAAAPVDPQKPWVCRMMTSKGEVCSKAYSRQCDLTKHQKNHTRPCLCLYCNKGFGENKELDRHYRSQHSGTPLAMEAKDRGKSRKNAVCPQCGYEGNGRSDNVTRHMEKKGHM